MKPVHHRPCDKKGALKDMPIGWYVFYQRHDFELDIIGPYRTLKQCRAVIASAEPCGASGCPSFSFGPDSDQSEAGKASGGVALCAECERSFIEWHIKEHGRPPIPAGRQ